MAGVSIILFKSYQIGKTYFVHDEEAADEEFDEAFEVHEFTLDSREIPIVREDSVPMIPYRSTIIEYFRSIPIVPNISDSSGYKYIRFLFRIE
jgi:hypothetical protein